MPGTSGIDRRVHPRVRRAEQVTFEPGYPLHAAPGANAVGVEMLDISKGGVCVLAGSLHEPGNVMKLGFKVPGTEADVPSFAEVMWAVPCGKGFKLGLQFLS